MCNRSCMLTSHTSLFIASFATSLRSYKWDLMHLRCVSQACPAGKQSRLVDLSGVRLRDCRLCGRGTLQWQSNQSECVPCPLQGVNCLKQDALDILPGYYLPRSDSKYGRRPDGEKWGDSVLAQPIACPMLHGCLGGETPGNASCAEGHEGVLCGVSDRVSNANCRPLACVLPTCRFARHACIPVSSPSRG